MSREIKTYYYGHSNSGGIYKILNTQNSRFYYGSAKEFKSRWKVHLKNLRGNRHSNKFMQNDFNKCGEEAFEFHVLEVVPGDRKDRTIIENNYLKKYYDNQKQCYNFARTADSLPRSVFSKTPESTKKLLSKKSKAMWADPKHRAKLEKYYNDPEWIKRQSDKQKQVSQDPTKGNSAEAHRKRHATKEHREKHSQALKKAWARDDGTRRKKVSKLAKKTYEANKNKIAKARLEAKAKYYGKVISPEGEVFEIYNAQAFIRKHAFSQMFYELLNGKYESYKGWKKLTDV